MTHLLITKSAWAYVTAAGEILLMNMIMITALTIIPAKNTTMVITITRIIIPGPFIPANSLIQNRLILHPGWLT